MMKKFLFSLSLALLCLAPLRAEGAVTTWGDLMAASGDVFTAGQTTWTVDIGGNFPFNYTIEIPIKSPDPASQDITEVVFRGTGALTAASGARHFKVVAGGKLTVESGVTLQGLTSGGGVELMDGEAEFNGTTFKSNSYADGGAANVSGGRATFSNVKFESNTTSSNGGAVNVASGATATFNGATFTSNTATNGGAVYAAGTATFSGTNSFTGNSAVRGGAVYVASDNATFTGTNSFTDNRASVDGGAVSVAATVTRLSFPAGTSFTNNNAGNGGAIHMGGGALTLANNVTFTGNDAPSGNGGAISLATGASASFQNGTIARNHAKQGGFLHAASGASASFNDDALTIELCSADQGGAIFNAGAFTLSGSPTFASNVATTDGGAIHSEGALTISNGPVFDRNTAPSGGAIYTRANISLGSAQFTGNGVSLTNPALNAINGGAIYTNSATALTLSGGTTTPPSFKNNSATGDGGAIYAQGSVVVERLSFPEENSAGGSGGAVYATGSIDARSSDFTKQKATADGGALCAVGDVTATSSTFTSNTATNDGGAIRAGNATATSCTFSSNASRVGGAISAGLKATLEDDLFDTNEATSQAGAVAVAHLDADHCTFRGNHSGAAGGAIFFSTSSTTSTIDNVVFERNFAGDAGGAMSFSGTDNEFRIWNCVFNDNRAVGRGGAVDLAGAKAEIYCSTFKGNAVEPGSGVTGGAVYLDPGQARIGNSTFYENEAGGGRGGAVYLAGNVGSAGDRSALAHNTFYGNNAQSGGAVATQSTRIYMMGNLLVKNNATNGDDVFGVGGQIYSQGYNLLSDYGESTTSGESDNRDWRNATYVIDPPKADMPNTDLYTLGQTWSESVIFETSTLAANGSSVQAGVRSDQVTPGTLALREATALVPDPAIGVIPNPSGTSMMGAYFSGGYIDERGARRTKSRNDIGAYEHAGELPPVGPTSGDVSGELSYIRISGIPNTLTTVGQTATLIAVAYDGAGKLMATSVPVKWSSSNEGVARFGKGEGNGNLVAVGLGQTTIRATSTVATRKGEYPSDTVQLYVTNETMEWLNVAPSVWEELYRQDFEQDGIVFSFADADPKRTSASSFRSSFRVAWNATPDQLTNVGSSSTPIEFERAARSFSPQGGWTSAKAGVGLRMTRRSRGDLLPIVCTWNFTWDALSKMLGRSVTDVPSDLFDALRLDFESTDGQVVPMIGPGGVSATDAQKALSPQLSKPLSVDKTNNGVNVTLTAFIANVSGTEARLIDGLLVVPDGASDNVLGGTLWTAQKPKSGGGSGGGDGEGGGGCDAMSLGALAILSGAALVMRKKK